MNSTSVDFADMTWNPVTGCRYGCEWCYARRIAERFGKAPETGGGDGGIHVLREKIPGNPYPYGFEPVFHAWRLDEPRWYGKPRTVLVGTMCDLFGDWVPDEVIFEIFRVCRETPHRYLFQTRNPRRYAVLAGRHLLPGGNRFWYGTTITGRMGTNGRAAAWFTGRKRFRTFLCVEPIREDCGAALDLTDMDWVIAGSQTGEGFRLEPEADWIRKLARNADSRGIPFYMQRSLAAVMNGELVQDYPWKARI